VRRTGHRGRPIRTRASRAVADGALIVEEGRIRFAGTMAEPMADAAVRAQYLSL